MDSGFSQSIDPEILDLAEGILTVSELEKIDRLVDLITGSETYRQQGIVFLQNFIGLRPKRPIYYLNMALRGLPDQTRDIIRYAGDFIDVLMKHFAEEQGRIKLLALQSSLGNNLWRLKKVLDEKLYNELSAYNKFIYVPAKHDFEIGSKPHRFSARDAITVCFLTKELVKKMIKLSNTVRLFAEDKPYESAFT